MKKIICIYCSTPNKEDDLRCAGCGAPLPTEKEKQENANVPSLVPKLTPLEQEPIAVTQKEEKSRDDVGYVKKENPYHHLAEEIRLPYEENRTEKSITDYFPSFFGVLLSFSIAVIIAFVAWGGLQGTVFSIVGGLAIFIFICVCLAFATVVSKLLQSK